MLRRSLEDLVDQYGTLNPYVIERSQLLDKCIVQYMKSFPGEEKRERLETIVRLHQGIESLDKYGMSSNPLVLAVSRELDRLLIEFIRG
ncbi:aspartyl-phosphate phosphatase Spo0E family protein [Cohnella silvisoli]|uniref:Aspartyl-phosphate phosphatase Spo0E family protein n=1 Tax=Cohnella silvisoli TaxID=2873699 RepID=A0ABV1KQL5_9BACL|nr:aspartyl-phosphate phosphatase Spo0E family protein [Cohnella silvisoli]